MPEQCIRFGVREPGGRSTDIWKCWNNAGAGKRDVYLTSRAVGKALKLSLHASGRWHVGFDNNKKDKLFVEGEAPASRYLGEWERPEVQSEPLVLAARVFFPWNAANEIREAPEDCVWLPQAPEGLATEIGIFLVNAGVSMINWPGKNAGTELVKRVPIDGGGEICAVHRFSETWPKLPNHQGDPKFFRGMSRADLNSDVRAVAWGAEQDGSISFVELPVAFTPTDGTSIVPV